MESTVRYAPDKDYQDCRMDWTYWTNQGYPSSFFFFFEEFYNYPPNTRPRLKCQSQSLKRNQHLLMQLPGVTTCERETEQDVLSLLHTGARRVLTDGLGGNAQDNWETRALDRNSGPWLKEWKAL